MPQITGPFSISTQIRAGIAIIALVCLLGAIFVDSELIPFHTVLRTSRSVQTATEATRWLFVAGALVWATLFIAWHQIRQVVSAGVHSIASWPDTVFWAVLCGLAIALRLAVFLLPTSELRKDALWYHLTAASIATGNGYQIYDTQTAYRPPGYSMLLALPYRFFGPHPELAWVWGIMSTGIIIATTYQLAHCFYGKTVARIAALLTAVYPALVLYTGQPMSDLTFTAGLLVVLYVVALYPPYRLVITISIGVALGLLTLTRGASIGLFLVIPLLWFIKNSNVRKLVFHFIVLTCAFAAPLIPWMARNYVVFGTPALGTNMGLNLYIGNHTNATGGYDPDIVLELKKLAISKETHLTWAPPNRIGSTPPRFNEAEVDRMLLREALQFLTVHPICALVILPKKVIHLFSLEITAAQILFQDQPSWFKYIVYGISQAAYMIILPLFIIRLINLGNSSWRPSGIQWMGFIITAYFTLLAIVFFGIDRYRLPFLPWMIIESSIVVAWLGQLPERNSSSVSKSKVP